MGKYVRGPRRGDINPKAPKKKNKKTIKEKGLGVLRCLVSKV